MDDSTQNNAMTEIALALAMGFFSLMVLTLVSMGAGGESPTGTAKRALLDFRLATAAKTAAAETVEVGPDDQLILYHRGQFLDRGLKTVSPAALAGDRRVILAIDPSLSLTDAQAVRARIPAGDLIVTTIDEQWLERLRGGRP